MDRTERRAASKAEMTAPLGALFRAMPPARGTKSADRIEGYLTALAGFSLEEIEAGIAKFLRGEVKQLSQKYCPHPPELAGVIREIAEGQAATVAKATAKKLYGYRKPNSAILETNITKDRAWQLIDNGVHPRGSIWCPGEFGTADAAFGDLFAPDPDWQPAKPINAPAATPEAFSPASPVAKERIQELLQKTGHRVFRDGRLVDPNPPPAAEPRKFPTTPRTSSK